MKTMLKPLNQRGIADLWIILVVILVVGVGVIAYMRVSNSGKADGNTTSSQTADEESGDVSEADAEKAANEADNISDEAVVEEDSSNVIQ